MEKTIKVTKEVWIELMQRKLDKGYSSINDLIVKGLLKKGVIK